MRLPTISTWREYLLYHPDRDVYDSQASGIQSLIDPNETPQNNFRLLSENKILVCLTKALMGNNIQLMFFNSIKKTAILNSKSEYFALSGFTERASAIRMDPNDIFKMTSRKLQFPSFEEIMRCTSRDIIEQLVPNQTMDSEKMDHHAILPPLLSEALMELEDLEPINVLLQLITKIRSLKTQVFEEEEEEYVDITNIAVNENDDEDDDNGQEVPEKLTFDDDDRSFEKRFYRPLRYLWCLIHAADKIAGVLTLTCNIPSTIAWLDKCTARIW